MTNNTNTLNGALQELGETIASNLENKGVSANASDGLTTLAGKINNIDTGETLPVTVTGNINGVYPPNIDVPISTILKTTYENDDNISIESPLNGAEVSYDIVGANNYFSETSTTNSNGISSFNFNTDKLDTYTILVSFLESKPFEAISSFMVGSITIFESIITYLQNITFSHSNGSNSRDISYANNESVTMTVQSFEEDNITPSKGSQVDYLIGTSSGYEDITLEPNVEYDLTGYDFDIIQLNNITYKTHNVLKIGQYTVEYNATAEYHIGTHDEIKEMRVKNNVLYLVWWNGNEFLLNTLTNLKLTAYVSGIVLRKYTDNFNVVDTVINNNQGYSSYTYNAQGIGEVYIKAQSHDDPIIKTEPYLISDWVKKDFTNIGNWVAFSGRVNTFSSNTDTTFTQRNGAKGGVHSQNTIFHLPNDDYIISFKIANGTIGTGVRVGLHSASYDDHHEKAVIGIENDSSGGFKFDYSDSTVTAVTKVATNLNKLNTGDLIEFQIINNTVEMFINGTSYVRPIALDWLHTPIWLYSQSWSSNNGSFSITDFRVKRIPPDS